MAPISQWSGGKAWMAAIIYYDGKKQTEYDSQTLLGIRFFYTTRLSSCPASSIIHPDATECYGNVPGGVNASD